MTKGTIAILFIAMLAGAVTGVEYRKLKSRVIELEKSKVELHHIYMVEKGSIEESKETLMDLMESCQR